MRAAFVLVILLVLAGCASPETEPTPSITAPPTSTPALSPTPSLPPPASLQRGVALSPKSYGAEDFPRFFTEAKAVGDLVVWGGSARELADDKSAANAVPQLAKANGLRFGAQLGYEGVELEGATETLVAYFTRHAPAYVVLGVELDRAQEKDAAFVEAFAQWYDGAYDAVKKAAPDTLVFPSFQLERMAGHTGGLYGGPNASAPKWDLLEKFPKRDLTAFTTYPGLVFEDPEEIPADFYQEAARRAGGPIGFTEVGHFAALDVDAPGWASSEIEQRAFVKRFLSDADAIDARLAVWLHLYDQPTFPVAPFQHMGLLNDDGTPRLAHEAWAS